MSILKEEKRTEIATKETCFHQGTHCPIVINAVNNTAKAQDLHSRQELIKELEGKCSIVYHDSGRISKGIFVDNECWAKIKKEITGG